MFRITHTARENRIKKYIQYYELYNWRLSKQCVFHGMARRNDYYISIFIILLNYL